MSFDTPEERTNIRILAIEDEDLLREYVCDYLDDIGFTTLQACNGREGIEMIRSEQPDLVLTDLRMPEVNGLDVLSLLQKDFPELPVIVISGTGTLNDVVQTLKYGAWDYILKPIHDYTILELSVKRVLERKRLLDENKRYREHLEEEVKKRTDELLKSTTKLHTLLNLASDAIFIHDQQGNILEVNEKAVNYTGISRDSIIKTKIESLFPESEKSLFNKRLSDLSQKSQILYETTLNSHQETSIPVEVSATLITMNGTSQFLSIMRDISERKKSEEQRKQLEMQIATAQKMESLGLLASGVAHDFNNILSALTGYTVLLRSKMQQGSSEVEYLQKINSIISMGQSITRRITTFIRKDKEDLTRVDIHRILEDTEAMLLPNCRKISLEFELKADNVFVLGDNAQLQNAFLNLGINARDAMPDGGTLRFSTENVFHSENNVNKQFISIKVSDTGSGMDDETIAKIFDPLFTTKERGKGTGLGLTSVLYCIKNLQGKISVNSKVGEGTIFHILFPVYEDISQ